MVYDFIQVSDINVGSFLNDQTFLVNVNMIEGNKEHFT